MGREFELKYTATPEIHRALETAYSPFRQIAMETTYFDTPELALSARKMTLRLRRENGTILCTLKCPLADGSKGEWELEATDLSDGLAALIRGGAPSEIATLAADGLVPVCGARFTRLATVLSTADGTAELALDRGVLLGGGKELPLCEVELELKSGSDEATVALANKLAETHGLKPESHSKFRRAFILAKGE